MVDRSLSPGDEGWLASEGSRSPAYLEEQVRNGMTFAAVRDDSAGDITAGYEALAELRRQAEDADRLRADLERADHLRGHFDLAYQAAEREAARLREALMEAARLLQQELDEAIRLKDALHDIEVRLTRPNGLPTRGDFYVDKAVSCARAALAGVEDVTGTGARVAEGSGLLSRPTSDGRAGSNPAPSVLVPPYRCVAGEHGPATIHDGIDVGWVARIKESLPGKNELAALIVELLNREAARVEDTQP